MRNALKSLAHGLLFCFLVMGSAAVVFLTAPQLSPLPNTFAAVRARLDQLILNETDGALHTFLAFAGSGERNPSSITGTDYLSTSAECKPSGEIDLASGSGTIYNGPAVVQWVQVSTTPGTAASSIDDNATAKIPLPVSYPVNVYPLSGTVFCTSLKYTRGASATGKFNVCYRPLDSAQVTWACP